MLNKKLLLIGIFIVVVIAGLIVEEIRVNQSATTVTSTATTSGQFQETQASSSTLIAPTQALQLTNVYHNDQYGFEFQYPNSWSIFENTFGNYYSIFNVRAAPNEGEAYSANGGPFLVNVVLPEFANKTFSASNSVTSSVAVSGVSGTEYKYHFEGHSETAIVLPFGQYKIILGTAAPYETVFTNIIATFKFLK